MKTPSWVYYLIFALLLFVVVKIANAGSPAPVFAAPKLIGSATDPGRCTTVTTTPVIAVAAGNKTGWCLYGDDGNTDELRFTLGDTASSTVGFVLNADSNFCDGSEGAVYVGPVHVAAESGTQTFCTLVY